ncbi:S1C family serine protease [Streptomyces rameus]
MSGDPVPATPAEPPVPGGEAPAEGAESVKEAVVAAPDAGETGVAAATDVAVPADRPRPLHDPDPYSTPPYGEPGPWAPAPPVQHPGAAPGHGTAVPPPAAPTAPLFPPAPPAPAVHGSVPAPAGPVPVVPAPSGPESVVPAPAGPVPQVPGHGPVPACAVPAVPAVPGAPVVPAVPGAPAVPAAQGAPAVPAVPGAPAVPAAQGAPVVPAPVVPAAPGASPGPVSGAVSGGVLPSVGEGVWGRDDPWGLGAAEQRASAPGPLQQTGAGRPTDGQRLRRARRRTLLAALCVALVSAGIGGVAGAYVEREGLGDGVRPPQAGRAPDSVAGIAARALPSVVTLHVKGADQADTGTGFVLDAQGHILTNNHVVEPAGPDGEISVTFSGGDTVRAKVVGRDSGYDLAVVQVHGVHGLTPLPLGNSDDVQVGDPVVAIGAPFDLADTVTSGIISAKERPITAGGEKSDGTDVSYVDALQTDAAINPGNSGGPLLDSRAEVIGINSAIRSAGSGSGSTGGGQAGSIGLGFAIPVNQAKRVAEELIGEGHATHPVIGVTLDMGYTGDGARIDSKSASGGPAVTRGGPGERAGLKAGDLITEVGGVRVHTGEELIVRIRAHRPGDRLRLTVERGGTKRDVSLVLGASGQN